MAKRKNNNWILFGLLGVVALLVVVAVVKQKSKPKGEQVMVEKAETRTIKEKVAASGKIFPVTEIKISSDVSGEVVELYVEEGDSVVAGQLLARIDPDAYQSQVERGQAGVRSAQAQAANARSQIETLRAQKEQIEAQLTNAREIHNRNEKLKKEGVISDADFDNSLSNLRALEANLRSSDASIKASQESVRAAEFQIQSAEAGLRELQTSLRRTTQYAPKGGIISKLNIEKGERVVGTIQMAGTEMMRIADLSTMEVRVDVSENDIPRVSIGDLVDIEVDAYIGRKFKGRVTQIANSANSAGGLGAALTTDQVTNFEVRILIEPASYADLVTPKKPYPFRPGMSASVDINTQTLKDVLSVPIQAVTTREKEGLKKKTTTNEDGEEVEAEKTLDDLIEVVFVAKGDTAHLVEVKTGIQDDSYIYIISGLKAGDEVISGPYTAVSRKLKQGMVIRRATEDELNPAKKKKKEED
ncbi:MAG TPA: efflux RND transporter periplasmic adaptor subunit [Saprospiraceae bacterium]|nr:efflux RND transporter periplasmic adaptor subunit [Saprospiraceae bacterium]HRK83685.1 efflux RND transporter periplasmic adaptor subunit [Saprospiraceae bacterium]